MHIKLCIYYFYKCLTGIFKTNFLFIDSLNKALRALVSIEVNHFVQSLEVIYVAAFVGSSTFYMYDLNTKNGELLIVSYFPLELLGNH